MQQISLPSHFLRIISILKAYITISEITTVLVQNLSWFKFCRYPSEQLIEVYFLWSESMCPLGGGVVNIKFVK